MLLLDPRTGSGDLAQPLRALGVALEVTELQFGDCAFAGLGVGERPLFIGVELKKLADILQCVETGRWSGHQLPGLVSSYDRAYLVVEGVWRPRMPDGVLETLAGRDWRPVNFGGRNWMYRDFISFLLTQAERGGVAVWRTTNREETVRWVASTFRWWQQGEAEHTSHLGLDRTTQLALRTQVAREQAVSLLGGRREIPLVRRIAAELPGVGVERSAAVAARFATVREMVEASEKEWQSIDGIGKTIAKRIVGALR